jgi:hypothetical protein
MKCRSICTRLHGETFQKTSHFHARRRENIKSHRYSLYHNSLIAHDTSVTYQIVKNEVHRLAQKRGVAPLIIAFRPTAVLENKQIVCVYDCQYCIRGESVHSTSVRSKRQGDQKGGGVAGEEAYIGSR